jgi:DNA-binding MarR family transcriptional regulator
LARLDAGAEAASPAVQQGLITRLAYAEAAGWLASQSITAHSVSLALRDRERVGRRELWLQHQILRPRRSIPAWEQDDAWLDADGKITRALALARLLERLPAADNPLVDVTRAEAWLAPLAPQATPFDRARFASWRAAHMPDGRRPDPRPALLRAAEASLGWMESGISDVPDAIQSLATAALLLKRMGAADTVPPPLWAAWPALCAPDDPGVLPRLRGDTAARLAPDGVSWPLVFLHLIAESARAGTRTLAELRVAEVAGLAFAAEEDKRSRLPATVDLLLRQPALTAPSLARQLDITPQAALRLFTRLEQAGLVREVTGRDSFRAFALAIRPAG